MEPEAGVYTAYPDAEVCFHFMACKRRTLVKALAVGVNLQRRRLRQFPLLCCVTAATIGDGRLMHVALVEQIYICFQNYKRRIAI